MVTMSSKAVAEMLGKRHDNFLRDIRKYVVKLGDEAPKYFTESTYVDGMGKTRSCFDITIKGCDLIAGRLIGEKSDNFRAGYVKVFGEVFTLDESRELTVDEVAKTLGCSERNVYRIIQSGKLPAVQKEVLTPVTKTFVAREALEEYMADRRAVK